MHTGEKRRSTEAHSSFIFSHINPLLGQYGLRLHHCYEIKMIYEERWNSHICVYLQMHVRCRLTRTQLPSLSFCMTVESRWRGSERHSSTRITLTGLRVSPRCYVTKVSLNATTGRWSGEDAGWMSLWLWGGSIGGRALTSVGLAPQTSPGVCTALRITTALSMTTSRWIYQHLCLAPTGSECTWTGQVAPCPSTASPLGPSVTFTRSIAPSQSPSTPGLGWRRMTAL